MHDPKTALAILDQHKNRYPDDWRVYKYAGLANRSLGLPSLDDFSKAFFLNPGDQDTAVEYIQCAGSELDKEEAESIIIGALRAHSSSSKILWAACKQCRSEHMLEQVISIATGDGGISEKQIRPLVNAACRVERFDLAKALFRDGIEAILSGAPTTEVTKKPISAQGLDALRDAVRVLDEAKIPHFAAAGTALGIVREGRPLAHDLDIDIGIFDEYFDAGKIRNAFAKDAAFVLDTPHPKNPKIGVTHRGGVSVDIFRYYSEGDKIYHNGVFVRWWNTPFSTERVDVHGFQVAIPVPKDRYLVENYGENWAIPDKTFDAFVSGFNREVIWPDYYAVHELRVLYFALRAKNREKVRAIGSALSSSPYLNDEDKAIIAKTKAWMQ
jgi:hypothetical protein